MLFFHILHIETPITLIAIQKTKSKKVSHTGAVINRQLRGKERNENQQDMKYTTPRAFQQKVIGNLDVELVQDGNMQDIRLLSTYKRLNPNITAEMTRHFRQGIYLIYYRRL